MATDLETRVETRTRTAPSKVRTLSQVQWLNEPAFVLLGYVLLAAVTRIAPGSLPQAIVAALLAMFGPGFSLTTLLYPRPDALDGVERLALSALLSMAVGGIAGFILIQTSWGLTLITYAIAVGAFNILCYVGVLYRRRGWAALEMPGVIDWSGFGRWFRNQSWGSLLIALALVALLAGGAGALYQASRSPGMDPPMTEFFLLDSNGQIENVPETAAPGATVSLNYGIINREQDAGQYQVLALVGDQLIANSGAVPLEPGQQQVGRLQVAIPAQLSGQVRLDILLFRDGKRYRNLDLWIDVTKP